MIDIGYTAKRITLEPKGFNTTRVLSVWSVSNCLSHDFCDYIDFWKHNGYWFFDSPAAIREVAAEAEACLADTQLIYLRAHPKQYDAERRSWSSFQPEPGWPLQPAPPESMVLMGCDVVSYWLQNAPECSPLSCNSLAGEIPVNERCLLDSVDDAIKHLEQGAFDNADPGPYRILEVNAVEWPTG